MIISIPVEFNHSNLLSALINAPYNRPSTEASHKLISSSGEKENIQKVAQKMGRMTPSEIKATASSFSGILRFIEDNLTQQDRQTQ